jgi:hypothetical protein
VSIVETWVVDICLFGYEGGKVVDDLWWNENATDLLAGANMDRYTVLMNEPRISLCSLI